MGYKQAMSILLLLLSVTALGSAKHFYKTSNDDADEYYFSQKLDHTRPVDKNTWQQRYFVMNNWFNATNNPLVILYICGEGECNNISPSGSFMSNVAQNFSGIVFSLEHRFYGKSQPFGYNSKSYSLENFQYLTAEQALYDLASFIEFIKETGSFGVTADMPWVTIGGSYPGALSAWFRSKFPYLTIGALASSAVVNSIDDFFAFDQQVSDSLIKGPGNCRQLVHDLNVNVTKLLKSGKGEEIYNLKSFFNSTMLNDGDFLFYFSDITVMGVQYGARVDMCNHLLANQTFTGILNSVANYALSVGVTPDQYGSYYLRNTTYSHERNARQWYYQVCSEFGWLFTPAKNYPMRSQLLDMEYWASWCARSYDVGVYPNQNATNNRLGGVDLQTTNLIFTNGGEDPWQWASKRTPSLPGIQSYVADCDQCGHCVDLDDDSPSDSQILRDIRAQTLSSFSLWVNEHYAKINGQNESFIRNKLNNFIEQK